MTANSPTGRVAVITGASSGIGEATARALTAGGFRVALLARRADRIQALADELSDGAIAVEADVTDRDSLVAAAQRVQDELGGADVLINNAGVMLLAPFTSEQRAEQRQMVAASSSSSRSGRHGVGHPHHPRRDQGAIEQFYDATAITADDIAEIIAFAVTRPHSVLLNEILVRPTSQLG